MWHKVWPLFWIFGLPHSGKATSATGSTCSPLQWQQDPCPYQNDGECDVDLGWCASNTDCADCDPCGSVIAGIVDCNTCLGLGSQCRWCSSSLTCTSKEDAQCSGGWDTSASSCDAANSVAGHVFTDPAVSYQRWHLEAINIGEAWDMGYTGNGVNIIFEDDALDIQHPDIAGRFNPQGSPSPNEILPLPQTAQRSAQTHGTEVVGLAVSTANNSECGVGVAYGATVSFARFNDPAARAIGVENNVNHISSNSWNYDSCALATSIPSGTQSYAVPGTTCPFNPDAQGSPCRPPCGTSPQGWVDSVGDTCEMYGAAQWCTPTGEAGAGWNTAEWGTINDWASGGASAFEACCECGGGASMSGGCTGMDWGGSAITGECIQVIASYCSSEVGHAPGMYDPGCQDHWDLFVDCTHQALSNQHRNELLHGVTTGRQGKGIVYLFAAGNEYGIGENVNFEGWLNSIHTISVGATRVDGGHAWYSSAGTAVLVSAPGGGIQGALVTTKPTQYSGGQCGAIEGGGTSFSTPIVAGVVALMLEANPALTWRDVQDIFARTSTVVMEGDPSWVQNGAGLWHSDLLGFGQVNAGAAVRRARDWQQADSKEHALLAKLVPVGLEIPADDEGVSCGVEITADEAKHVESVEHVVLYLTTSGHESRGELKITLTSPSGVESLLAWSSSEDGSGGSTDYEEFKFMTVKNWGESAAGIWTIRVTDRRDNAASGQLASWRLAIYGKCSDSANGVCKHVPQPSSTQVCNNDCPYFGDNECDDGGVGAAYSVCPYGSDCNDCGPRDVIVYYDHDGSGSGTSITTGNAHCVNPHATTTTSKLVSTSQETTHTPSSSSSSGSSTTTASSTSSSGTTTATSASSSEGSTSTASATTSDSGYASSTSTSGEHGTTTVQASSPNSSTTVMVTSATSSTSVAETNTTATSTNSTPLSTTSSEATSSTSVSVSSPETNSTTMQSTVRRTPRTTRVSQTTVAVQTSTPAKPSVVASTTAIENQSSVTTTFGEGQENEILVASLGSITAPVAWVVCAQLLLLLFLPSA